jgi:hypothetical protein
LVWWLNVLLLGGFGRERGDGCLNEGLWRRRGLHGLLRVLGLRLLLWGALWLRLRLIRG